MAPAIEDAVNTVNSQLYSGKPAVIAVITDGRPSDVDAVKKRIVQTANSLRDSNLLTLAFIEIGTPERYLAEFDNALVKQGAKEDIVTVFPFAQVNSQGLSKTLELAIESRQAQKQAALQAKPEQKPQQRQSANSEPQEEDSTPKPPPPSPPKPKAPQESEQDRLTREKREQEDRKMRRSAANQSYDFSQKRSPATPQSKPAAKATSAPSRPLEVDEKEAVRKQQSNRNY